jgi:Mlc titration factor MtfA (ptsG expression regulator)
MKTIAFILLTSLPTSALDRPKLQIMNAAPNAIEVFWETNDGHRVSNGKIEPGKDKIIGTTIGHRFMIVDGKRETEVVSQVRVQGFRYDPAAKDGVPAFYTQVVRAQGYPICGSAKVSPYALKEAVHLVDLMLAERPDVREAMIASGSRLCVLAHNEFTTDQPEFAHLGPVEGFEALSAKESWDARARGLGGSETDPFCSCAEENLLAYDGDPYDTENILIHEFAHNMHLRGLTNVDPTFDTRLKAAFDDAMKAGLWKGAYASSNHHEYWAEGVQSWFDNNRQNDAQHNHVDTRDELLAYDPKLAAICREVFGDTVLKYTKPQTRLTGHLAGYDPAKAPKFVWPERLLKARGLIKQDQRRRFEEATGTKEHDQRLIAGWTVKIHPRLFDDAVALEKALGLLRMQLDEIVRVVPAKSVTELRKVPLWINPEYPKTPPRAEYHPGAGWLRDNGRDPVMEKAVEFTNVRIFEAETRRMPNFTLHELAHAYHDRVLGFEHAEIEAVYQRAKAAGKYDKVPRQDSAGRKRLDKAYAMTNAKEYFAECTEAFFARNDFFPFTREELKAHDPEMFALLGRLWGVE